MSRSRSASPNSVGWLLAALFAACAGDDAPVSTPSVDSGTEPTLTREQLMDPATCQSCHPRHYREWQSSMHAYAAEDPVFLAMNRRGQRETHGQLGEFCVRCHAPMALREGATHDGLNLESLPAPLRGVTCYFCHNVVDHGADAFNNPLSLADDTRMRAAISDPVPNGAHTSSYSHFQDRNRHESSVLCGSCHDVVTPAGVHLERTFREYEDSLFAQPGLGFDSCSGCHMPGRTGRAASGAGLPERQVHEHLWPGVDVALTEFPDSRAQRLAVACALASNVRIVSIATTGLGEVAIRIDSSAGHHQPSGSAHDRRMWLEVTAFAAEDQVLFQSGAIADGELEEKAPGAPGFDPSLALFRDWIYDAAGEPVPMFWEAAASSPFPTGYQALTLPVPLQLNMAHSLEARYRIPDLARVERLRVRLRMRAVGLDVLRDLVNSGDLDPDQIDAMPTFTLYGASSDWDPLDGTLTSLWPEGLKCPDSYRCLLDDEACPETANSDL